jgi:hypothetical protein
MFVVHRCIRCRVSLGHSELVTEPDGFFGPESLCPRCGGLVLAQTTALGWAVVLAGAVVLSAVVFWLQT